MNEADKILVTINCKECGNPFDVDLQTFIHWDMFCSSKCARNSIKPIYPQTEADKKRLDEINNFIKTFKKPENE